MQFANILGFIATAGGIYVAYLKQGDVSEKLSTLTFNGERFEHLSALPMLQSISSFLVALLALVGEVAYCGGAKGYPSVFEYWLPSLTSTVGPVMGYASLRNISYPAQVVVKSCKMIPVMLMGAILYGVRYSLTQWVVTGTICGGLVIFSSAASKAATEKLADAHMLLGYSLCFGNLVFDGFTNSNQDVINKKYPNNSPLHMMCFMGLWQSIYYLTWFCGLEALGYGQTLADIHRLSLESPAFFHYLMQFCICGALGQIFIYHMIYSQGSLTTVLVTTTRKFFSILLSVFLNGTALVPQQWVGIFAVFTGVLWNIQSKHAKKAKQVPQEQKTK